MTVPQVCVFGNLNRETTVPLKESENGKRIFTCLLDICVHGTLFVWCGMMCSAYLEQLLDSS